MKNKTKGLISIIVILFGIILSQFTSCSEQIKRTVLPILQNYIDDSTNVKVDTIILTDTLVQSDTIYITKFNTIRDTIYSQVTSYDTINTVEFVDTCLTKVDTISYNSNKIELKDIIGINGGLLLRGFDSLFNWVPNMRTFYLIDHDMKGRSLDSFFPNPCLAECPNINCNWDSTNAAWKYRFCTYNKEFKFNTLTLQKFLNDDGTSKHYPDFFFSKEELSKTHNPYYWGFKYGEMLAISLNKEIDAIEVGNELHGQPGLESAREWSYGVSDGVKSVDSAILVGSPDLSGRYETFNGKYIQTNIKDWDLSKFDFIQFHEYGLDTNFKCTYPPEVFLIPELDSLQGVNKPIYAGEFGYDSNELGEYLQSAYIIRSYLIFMKYGVEKAFYYQSVDDGEWAAPFQFTGLVSINGVPKQSFKDLKWFSETYGNYTFKEDKTSFDSYKYIITNGLDDVEVTWNIDSFPKFKKL